MKHNTIDIFEIAEMLLEQELSSANPLKPEEINRFDSWIYEIQAKIDELRDEVGYTGKGYPTWQWIASVLNDSDNIIKNSIERYYDAVEKNQDISNDAFAIKGLNTLAVQSVLSKKRVKTKDGAKLPLIVGAPDGIGYTFPGRDKNKKIEASVLSRFKSYLTMENNEKRFYDDTKSVVRGAADQETIDWIESLNGTQREFVEIYKSFDKKTFSILKHIYETLKTSGRADANNLIRAGINDDKLTMLKIKNAGFISSSGTLLGSKVEDFFSFLSTPPKTAPNMIMQRFKGLNPEIDYYVKRTEYDKALIRNKLNTMIDTNLGSESTDFEPLYRAMDSLSMSAKTLLRTHSSFNSIEDKNILLQLKSQGLLDDDNNITQLGQAVQTLLRQDKQPNNRQTHDLAFSRINPEQSTRRVDRANNVNSQAKTFFNK